MTSSKVQSDFRHHAQSSSLIFRKYTLEHDAHLIRSTISTLRTQMSDQNLSLLPDYHQRVAVLADLHFISSPTSSSSSSSSTNNQLATTSRVELKGKVACEIHSADELVLTELILENVLAEYTPQEIVALLSSFVFQEKTEIEPRLSDKLRQGVERIVDISERVNHYQVLHQVILGGDEGGGRSDAAQNNSAASQAPRFGLVEVVYNWADGVSFREIMGLTDVMEGTIVRVVTRLDETCREVMSVARLVGDPGLYAKMERAREMIRRDVVFTASLYM
jgi:antiviral helicase SKI2